MNSNDNYIPPLDFVVDANAMCRCGRSLQKPHCVSCGSSQIRATRKHGRYVETPHGLRFVMGFRCITCGHTFQADSVCAAPAKKLGRAPRHVSQEEKEFNRLPKQMRDKKVVAAARMLFNVQKRLGLVDENGIPLGDKPSLTDVTDDPFFNEGKKDR